MTHGILRTETAGDTLDGQGLSECAQGGNVFNFKWLSLAQLIVATFAGLGQAWGGPPPTRLWPLSLGGRVGYIDASGKAVVAPRFDEASAFSEGRAAVLLGRTVTPDGALTGGQYGFIDETGKLVIPAIYRSVKDFHDNRAPFSREDRTGGYLDPAGNVVLDGATGRVMPFANGLAAVELRRDQWVFVDTAGKTVFAVPGEGDMSDPAGFSEDRLVLTVRIGDGPFGTGKKVRRTWILDRTGKRLHDLPHKFVRDRSEGLYAARDDATELWGFLDDIGAWAVPATYRSAWGFRDGLAVVRDEGGRQMFLDRSGATRCAQAPDVSLELPTEGLAMITLVGENDARKVGYIDAKTCAVRIAPTWDDPMNSLSRFSGGVALVRKKQGADVLEGYIDATGKLVRPLTSAVWLEKPVPVE